MATAWISEYASLPPGVNEAQIAGEPPIVSQTVTFTTTVASNAFSAVTRFIQFETSADAHYLVGANPSATTSHMKYVAGKGYFCAVQPGQKIAFVTAS